VGHLARGGDGSGKRGLSRSRPADDQNPLAPVQAARGIASSGSHRSIIA
jgi:hypothetical protein